MKFLKNRIHFRTQWALTGERERGRERERERERERNRKTCTVCVVCICQNRLIKIKRRHN
jgi:hypothetical protein